MLLQLNIHPSQASRLLSPDIVRSEPFSPTEGYLDLFGNLVTRVVAPPGLITFHNDFLIEDSGVNSGFMILQVTAAALVSENKSYAFPASVDSIPTSAGQEDHVSMATHGALKARRIAHNVAGVLGIELMAGAQGVDFHAPLESSPALKAVRDGIRACIPFHVKDRYLANDLAWAKATVLAGDLVDLPALGLF